MPNNFAIFAYPRTGSYHLVSLLNSAPDIVCHGEIFKKERIELSRWHRKHFPNLTPDSRDKNGKEFIEKLRGLNPKKHFGFKFFPSHMGSAPCLRAIANRRDWKKIALVRDPIEVYASNLRAKKTNIWVVKNSAETPAESVLNVKVEFSPETWEKHLGFYSIFLQKVASLNNAIIARYGEYATPEGLGAILEFIGSKASPASLQEGTVKQFSRPIQDAFSNWSELEDYLARNPAPAIP